jgi:hypothetical protein
MVLKCICYRERAYDSITAVECLLFSRELSLGTE